VAFILIQMETLVIESSRLPHIVLVNLSHSHLSSLSRMASLPKVIFTSLRRIKSASSIQILDHAFSDQSDSFRLFVLSQGIEFQVDDGEGAGPREIRAHEALDENQREDSEEPPEKAQWRSFQRSDVHVNLWAAACACGHVVQEVQGGSGGGDEPSMLKPDGE
jgi:hypothetical protein